MAIRVRHTVLEALALGLCLGTGCYSGVGEFDGNEGLTAGDDAGDSDGDPDGDGPDLGPAAEMPAPTTRFFRLTHQQWENTVQDLFGLPEPTGLSSEFRADPFVGGFEFDNNALSLQVDQALWQGYQRAAVDMAEIAVSDPSIVSAIAPDVGDEATRAAEFIRSFGERVFRRPLTETEIAEYQALFDSGTALYEDMTGFEAGMRLVLEGMLQSPWFLYRVEASEEVEGQVIPLNSYEIASRLSFFLWNTTPDEELLAVAEAGQLGDPAVVEEQTRRMLDSPKAEQVVERFHHQLLHVDKFTQAAPSAAFYPDAPADLGQLAVQEHDLFLRHAIFEQEGSWRDLLTSTETFVNDDLARIYGLSGDFGDEFTRVDLPANERRGIFTQVGFLVANATSVHPDPIHRGAYLARTIACHTIAAPPDDITPVPAPDEDATNRETVAAHTEAPGSTCMGCHTPLINPFGFPFEGYDSTGAFRTMDNGRPVDAKANVILGDGAVPVEDALDLAEAMAEDSQVHQCYMEHWMEFAMGRPYDEMDAPLVERLSVESLDDVGIKDLLVEFTKSRPFLTRATQEMQ